MAEEQLFLQSEISSLQCPPCYVDNIDNNQFYLPVILPSTQTLTPDVVLWLIELRHKSDSDTIQEVRIPHQEDSWSDDDNSVSDNESQDDNSISHTHQENIICNNFPNNEDTVLNLDLHRKKPVPSTNDNDEDLYQIWEGLKIPRQSLNGSSSKIPNLNISGCECLSKNSEADSRSFVERRGESYWEINPMYSGGSLKDSKEKGRDDLDIKNNINVPQNSNNDKTKQPRDLKPISTWKSDIVKLNTKINKESNISQEKENLTHQQQYFQNVEVKSESNINTVLNKNWRLTDISEESTDSGECILNSENNFGLEVSSGIFHSSSEQLTFQQLGDDVHPTTSPVERKCINILNNLDDMIQTFEHIQEKVLAKDGNPSGSEISLKDQDFDHMCERAELIIEETLKCQVNKGKSVKNVEVAEHSERNRNNSEMSDEVFVKTEPEDATNENLVVRSSTCDINEIFDNGANVVPPMAPLRRKKIEKLTAVSATESNISEASHNTSNKDKAIETVPTNTEIHTNNPPLNSQKKELSSSPNAKPNIKPKPAISNRKCNEYLPETNSVENIVIDKEDVYSNKLSSSPNESIKNSNDLRRSNSDSTDEDKTMKSIITHEHGRVDGTPIEENYSSLESDLSFDYKIHLTKTKPISFSTFPPNNNSTQSQTLPLPASVPTSQLTRFKSQNTLNEQKSHSFSLSGRPLSFQSLSKSDPNSVASMFSNENTTLLKYEKTEDSSYFENSSKFSAHCETSKSSRLRDTEGSRNKLHATASLDESLERTRKNSASSDIAAWKQRLRYTASYYHDEEMDPNNMHSDEWFSSNESERVPVSNVTYAPESPDLVPEIQVTGCKARDNQTTADNRTRTEKLSVANIASLIEAELRGKQPGPYRIKKARSMVISLPPNNLDEKGDGGVKQSYNWAEIFDPKTAIIKEGTLSRTKILEIGKKVRKNWTTSYAVLTKRNLTFFKDLKAFNAVKINTDKFQAELTMELKNAFVELNEKLSSRKNVLVVGDGQGLVVLLQLANSSAIEQWYHMINTTIALQAGVDPLLRLPPRECIPAIQDVVNVQDDSLKSPKIVRARSVKLNKELESNEDLTSTAEERQTKNKARLKKFFGRRPTKESLVKQGIYKDEPMFGRNLCDVVTDCSPFIPRFVSQCVGVIESKDENMKTDGLYRASGNLSQVQKIRLQVDQNQLCVLEQEDDVHVLTGALKLFFRELKKPLIPFEVLSETIQASGVRDQKDRVERFRYLVRSLPTPNHDTLEFLLNHLLKVTQNQEFNRMHIPNIAIVFGPTLMWPEEESLNMALDLMKQNQVIECLLTDYNEIFS